jgi:hypothetical protein
MGVTFRVKGSPIDLGGWSRLLIAGSLQRRRTPIEGNAFAPPREGITGPGDAAILHMTCVRPARRRARPWIMKGSSMQAHGGILAESGPGFDPEGSAPPAPRWIRSAMTETGKLGNVSLRRGREGVDDA